MRRQKTKQDMPELHLHWWVLLPTCRWAERGGWGRSPGSTPQSAGCTSPQTASRLARSRRSLASRQQTNKSSLIKKENNLLNHGKSHITANTILTNFFFKVIQKGTRHSQMSAIWWCYTNVFKTWIHGDVSSFSNLVCRAQKTKPQYDFSSFLLCCNPGDLPKHHLELGEESGT